MEYNHRKSVFDELKAYDPQAHDEDYIEVTEWVNGLGYDITIWANKSITNLSLPFEHLEAINYLVKSLEYNKGGKE